jgi:DNA-binding beta-propeller fold protein YncE
MFSSQVSMMVLPPMHRKAIPPSLSVWLLMGALACASSSTPGTPPAPAATPAAPTASAPSANYWVYVGAESADLIHRVRFGPDGAVVEKTFPVGESASELEGPHGLQVSRDGKFLHLTTGHGSPDGKYWRYVTGADTLAGPGIFLGFFPASIDLTPDGLYAFIVNFNLHGGMVPSSVSVVYTPTHTEVARTETCTMPHGSRVDPAGLRQYSTCMMDDQVVEIDTRTFAVLRRFGLAKGKEGPIADHMASHAGHGAMTPASCSPTWAQPSTDGAKVYVACNKADEIVEIDVARWEIARRFKTGRGPYNLAVTPDGRLLIATLKQGAGVQMFDLTSGESVLTARSSTTVTHGIAVSADSRYAFVSNEAVGAAPGKVDVYDLRTLTRVADVPVGQQAGGIAFWKMEPATR